jgi:hypothetical protein
MIADAVRAERHAEIRSAAEGWRATGLIDDTSCAGIGELFSDDRIRLGLVTRILVGVFTFVAAMAAFGFLLMITKSAAPALMLAPLAWLATELLATHGRRAQGGIEEGSSVAAFVLVLTACGWVLYKVTDHSRLTSPFLLVAAVVFCLVAVWRWGMPAWGIVGAFSLFLWLARSDHGRLLWLLVPLLLAAPLYWATRTGALAPSQRAAARGAFAVALAALYVAVNHAAAEHSWIENIGFRPDSTSLGWCGPLTAVATTLLPLAVLIVAVRLRDRLLLALGALMTAASLVTLRFYVHIAPLWVILTVSGAATIALVLVLRRLLDGGAGKERLGLTAEPLFSDSNRQRVLEIAATLAAFTPQARELSTPSPEPDLKPGGGQFGGGGASETF